MDTTIREVIEKDTNALKRVIDSNELFPSELLHGMLEDYLNNKDSTDIWLTRLDNGIPVAVAYCAPERMTEGTFNLYLIAVHKDFQGKGIGSEMMSYVERLLEKKKQRVLIVETSALPEFELTRKFYDDLGYHREATIRDFYQDGEDKVIFWKKLSG